MNSHWLDLGGRYVNLALAIEARILTANGKPDALVVTFAAGIGEEFYTQSYRGDDADVIGLRLNTLAQIADLEVDTATVRIDHYEGRG